MTTRKSFFKFLEVIVNEDERARVFREFLEHKTDYSVFVEKVILPGITDSFEIHNLKLTSPGGKVRINAEIVKLTSTQLSSLVAAGKILLNSASDIPVEFVEGYGVFISIGPENSPEFELFARRAMFKGIEFKIRYDGTTSEPEFTGTLSATDIDSEISISQKGVEIPTTTGTVDLTFNLKTLTGTADIRLSGKKETRNSEDKKVQKKKKKMMKEMISFDGLDLNLTAEFTLFPYSL